MGAAISTTLHDVPASHFTPQRELALVPADNERSMPRRHEPPVPGAREPPPFYSHFTDNLLRDYYFRPLGQPSWPPQPWYEFPPATLPRYGHHHHTGHPCHPFGGPPAEFGVRGRGTFGGEEFDVSFFPERRKGRCCCHECCRGGEHRSRSRSRHRNRHRNRNSGDDGGKQNGSNHNSSRAPVSQDFEDSDDEDSDNGPADCDPGDGPMGRGRRMPIRQRPVGRMKGRATGKHWRDDPLQILQRVQSLENDMYEYVLPRLGFPPPLARGAPPGTWLHRLWGIPEPAS